MAETRAPLFKPTVLLAVALMAVIVMMILRPEGLWPSKRRAMELHEPVE